MSATDAEILEGLCDRFMLAQEATGLLKGAFAKRVGLTSSQLTNISTYRNPPSHEAIHRAIHEFGFTSDWFYVGSKSGFRDPSLVQRLLEAESRLP